MDEIECFVQEQIDAGLLLNQEKAWQPHDFLPDSEKPTEEWIDEVSPAGHEAARAGRVDPMAGRGPGLPPLRPPLLSLHLVRQLVGACPVHLLSFPLAHAILSFPLYAGA
tara:strand:- start:899 stop:1228 length:330 start_codon:yes stop_codon:yes gene_type:complete